jgi:hypothetical protein
MLNRIKLRHAGRGALMGLALLASGACHDDVDNLNSPDRARATRNPSDVEALIGGAFYPNMFGTTNAAFNSSLSINQFMYGGAEFVATLGTSDQQQQYEDLVEPRRRHNNAPHISQGVGPHGPRNFWANMGRVSNVVYEGLRLINDGMRFVDSSDGVDRTARAQAFAKFMQGWSWGYQAMIFDRIHVVPETTALPPDNAGLQALIHSSLVDWPEGQTAALAAIDEAIRIARENPTTVNFPALSTSTLWFGTPTALTNAQFIAMANTLAARLLVISARTPAERAAVNWQRVLSYTAAGLTTSDFVVQLNTSRISTAFARIQANSTGSTNGRWHYRAIGPSDQSGAYQAWAAAPVEQRNRFNIVTPDRRVTGATPTSDGSYTRYRADNNGFLDYRGLYLFSAYQWSRHAIRNNLTGSNTGSNSGTTPMISADENNLLRAEALLRTGDRAGAATLINITRTRQQRLPGGTMVANLPAISAADALANRVPSVATPGTLNNVTCVPRLDSGACGDLLTAIRYERMLELAGLDPYRGYADARGFGILPDGALLSFPVPGNVLELYGLAEYSYGGVGQPGSAVYAPATLP